MACAMCWSGRELALPEAQRPWAQAVAVRQLGGHKPLLPGSTSLSWQDSGLHSDPALSPFCSSDEGRQEEGQQWAVGHKSCGAVSFGGSVLVAPTPVPHTPGAVWEEPVGHVDLSRPPCPCPFLPCLPCPAAGGGGAAGGTCPALSWQHEGAWSSLQPQHGGLSETGERLRSAVALTCQGRLENSVLSPPHRCIQFLSTFITPSCTGPASRAGGRSQGGLGIYFLE